MKILICNERFLFRFGVDRVLMLLAKYFKKMGHSIILMGNKMDEDAIAPYADQLILLPECQDYININEETCIWLEKNWNSYFNEQNKPDIILVAGWPFYNSIEFFNKVCSNVIFNDYGAVPIEGFEGGARVIQEKLRNLRRDYLPKAHKIIAISNFIEQSQSIVDGAGKVSTQTILLGADHMGLGLWKKDTLALTGSKIINEVLELKAQNKKIIFLLGRWEKGYKNSEVSFDILKNLKRKYSNIVLLALSKAEDMNIPKDLIDNIKPLGFVDDEDLQELMRVSDVGICPSLWEGFNLPLAEMQILNKPVFVFNKGAHPEVVCHPWYLCETVEEMEKKVINALEDNIPLTIKEQEKAYKQFTEYFTWERCAKESIECFIKMIYKDRVMLIDVSNACHDTANSGVIRVTRRIARNIQARARVVFVLWDSSIQKYVFPTEEEIKLLAAYNGPIPEQIIYKSKPNSRTTLDEVIHEFNDKNMCMLFTETISEQSASIIRPYLRNFGMKIAAIFYDAIPILHPEFCNEAVTNNHANYMKGLTQCNIVIPISEFSKGGLLDFWKENKLNPVCTVTNLLTGELGGVERNREMINDVNKRIKILCVSTLEPRKNHKTLLKACVRLSELHNEIDWELNLVGNRYVGSEDIIDCVEEVGKKTGRVKWLGVVDDAALTKLYNECTFTVYPSMIEGFGMPIMESIWNGRPCICFNEGPMGELAIDGGCLTTDVKDVQALTEAIYKLASDKTFRAKLQTEAITRYFKTWDDYTVELLNIIYPYTHNDVNTNVFKYVNRQWQDVLYRDGLIDSIELSHAERLSLIGLLETHKPQCCIQIGMEQGETLSILSRYAERIFSINNVLNKDVNFKHANVTVLQGEAEEILPTLIEELEAYQIDIDIIVINKNTSIAAVEKVIDILDQYIPKKSFFVAICNSFDPIFRNGLLELHWGKLKNLQWIDIDFIPGGITNNILQGGIGLAYFNVLPREDKLEIKLSNQELFKILNNK